MKTTILTVLLLALLAATPATPPPAAAQTITPGGMAPTVNVTAPSSGPSVVFNNVYQTLGECQALPRVTGVLGVCGQTLLVKAGGAP